MSRDITDDKSTLVQVMAITWAYVDRSLSTYCVTNPQWLTRGYQLYLRYYQRCKLVKIYLLTDRALDRINLYCFLTSLYQYHDIHGVKLPIKHEITSQKVIKQCLPESAPEWRPPLLLNFSPAASRARSNLLSRSSNSSIFFLFLEPWICKNITMVNNSCNAV